MAKKNGFLTLLLLSALSTGSYALDLDNPLPNWIDAGREKADGRPPVMAPTRRGAPPSNFRMPAEYEPVGAVVLGWAGYTPMLNGIAKAVTGPGRAQLWVVGGPSSISGVPAGSYSRIPAPLDTVWVRDYGPFGIANGRPGIVDSVYRHYQYRRDDDAVPGVLGQAKKIDVFGMPIIMDGGNLMVDSKGNLFMTKRTYLWNSGMSKETVDNHLKNYLKVKNIITFDYAGYPGEPADGTGHIDMFMKLLDDHTVLFAVTEDEPFKTNSLKAMEYFKNRRAPDGEMYRIVTVPAWVKYGTWYTYTNSLVVNKVAILPSYSGSQHEAAAKAAYEASGYTVVPVNSDASITAGGSIHCVTQTIPVLPDLRADEVFTPVPQFRDMDVTVPLAPLQGAGTGTAVDQLVTGF